MAIRGKSDSWLIYSTTPKSSHKSHSKLQNHIVFDKGAQYSVQIHDKSVGITGELVGHMLKMKYAIINLQTQYQKLKSCQILHNAQLLKKQSNAELTQSAKALKAQEDRVKQQGNRVEKRTQRLQLILSNL